MTAKDLERLQTEEDTQQAIIEYLQTLRFEVLQTTVRIKQQTCPRCHAKFRGRGDYGATEGIPDLMVSRSTWPPGAWIGLEVKRPHGWKYSNKEQARLHDAGRIYVVTSIEEAAAAIASFEKGGPKWQ